MVEYRQAEAFRKGPRPPRLRGFLDRLLPPQAMSLSPTARLRLRQVVGASLLSGLTTGLFAPLMYGYQGPSYSFFLLAILSVLLLGNLLLLRWIRSETFAGVFFCVWMLGVMVAGCWQEGAISLAAGQWNVLLPLTASFLVGARMAVVCTSLSALNLAWFAFKAIGPLPIVEDKDLSMRLTSLFTTVFIGLLSVLYETSRKRAEEERDAAEARALKLAEEQAARMAAEANQRSTSALLDSISEPLIALELDGRLRFLNHEAEELVGQPRSALVGRSAREVYPFSRLPLVLERCEQAVREGRAVEFEAELSDGRWHELRASPLEDGLCLYLRDITDRKETQQVHMRLAHQEGLRADVSVALAEQGALLGSLVRCCEAVVQHLDVDLVRIWTPDARDGGSLTLQACSGRDIPPERTLMGSSAIEFIAREKRSRVMKNALSDSAVEDGEWVRQAGMSAFAAYPLMMGDVLVGVVDVLAMRPLDGHTLAALGALADTIAQGIERRRAQDTLHERAGELARSNAELAQFAYVASHDLQEPLRAVTSYGQLLARRYRGKLDTDADDFIGFMVEGCNRMKRLIQDLLTYSRVGTQSHTPSPIDAGRVLARTLENLQASIDESGARVTFDPLPVVQADETQLGQLFQNLIGNALKFRAPDVPPHIHVSAQRRGSEWVLSIRDNGIGIEPQYFERIFVIFQRLHSEVEYVGTGIGLAICKKIVERHGGRIWVESVPGRGTTFSFTFPVGSAVDSRAGLTA